MAPQAIFFDMDATVIAEESLVEVAKAAGKEAEVATLTAQAMAGGMDFAESLRLRLSILKGTHRSVVLGIRSHLNPGIRALADSMHARGVKLFLVSGGFMDLAVPVAKGLRFTDVCANRFAWNGDVLAGDVEGDIVGAEGKRAAVERWCIVHRLDPKLCIAVGDGANDQNMMGICGLAVGYEPKKALWDKIAVCNAIGDHELLLMLLTAH
jgi:phosphoserine phosphatase